MNVYVQNFVSHFHSVYMEVLLDGWLPDFGHI